MLLSRKPCKMPEEIKEITEFLQRLQEELDYHKDAS